ncbi:MAG TPA: hypothetical protein VMF67_15735 [Rhizomicrobium sp.]|nr:hypothetical protein [Rhizomicrobium sp.]
MQTQWSSEEMLEALRALGGTAENIRVDESKGALFACDPERPVVLRVPENLLFPLEGFEFANGFLRLKDPEHGLRDARDFLGHYEIVVGRPLFARAEATVAAFDSLETAVKDVLAGDFGLRTSFEGDPAWRIERQFIERRAIRRGGGWVVAPVLELAEPDARGLAIDMGNGLRIAGAAPDGVRAIYPFQDPLAIFQRFGSAAPQPVAFSLPMTFWSGGIEISIARDLHLGDRRGEVIVPQLNVVARDRLVLSHLMLGHSAYPRLARGIFRARMSEAGLSDADAQFDRIVLENTARLLGLLDMLEENKDQATDSLRTMARHQLEAASWSIGTRKI